MRIDRWTDPRTPDEWVYVARLKVVNGIYHSVCRSPKDGRFDLAGIADDLMRPSVTRLLDGSEIRDTRLSPRPYKLGQACDGSIDYGVLALAEAWAAQAGVDFLEAYNAAYPDREGMDGGKLTRIREEAEWEGVAIPERWGDEELVGLVNSLVFANQDSLLEALAERHPKLSQAQELRNNREWVRIAAQDEDPAWLSRMAKHESAEVRKAVAGNPNAPVRVIVELESDADEDVAAAATKAADMRSNPTYHQVHNRILRALGGEDQLHRDYPIEDIRVLRSGIESIGVILRLKPFTVREDAEELNGIKIMADQTREWDKGREPYRGTFGVAVGRIFGDEFAAAKKLHLVAGAELASAVESFGVSVPVAQPNRGVKL